MKEQGLAYGAAINAAIDDLDRICQESERLKNRLYQLDAAVEALKPLMVLIETPAEPVHADRWTPQTVGTALPQVVPQNLIESADPIRRRIDSVLGLSFA